MKKRIKKENTNFRFNIMIVIVYIIGIVLISRLFVLQIINGAEYREASNTRLSREKNVEASRGEILDRSGNVLATTESSFNLELYKTKVDDETLNKCILNLVQLFEQYNIKYPDSFPVNSDCTEFSLKDEALSKWLNKYKLDESTTPEEAAKYFMKKYDIDSNSHQEARKIISIRYELTIKGYSSTKSLELAQNVPREIVAIISEQNAEFPGVTITTESIRKYNYGTLASHIIGYIGKISENEYNQSKEKYDNDDYVGRTGIEASFEDYLKGEKRNRRNRNVS